MNGRTLRVYLTLSLSISLILSFGIKMFELYKCVNNFLQEDNFPKTQLTDKYDNYSFNIFYFSHEGYSIRVARDDDELTHY